MDLSLMSVEPHPLSVMMSLMMLGPIGYVVIRRWRWSVALVAPVAVWLIWRLVGLLVPMLGMLRAPATIIPPDARHYLLVEVVANIGLGLFALLVGLGLPALGWRHGTMPAHRAPGADGPERSLGPGMRVLLGVLGAVATLAGVAVGVATLGEWGLGAPLMPTGLIVVACGLVVWGGTSLLHAAMRGRIVVRRTSGRRA